MGDAQLNVALVRNQGEADLCVHRVSSWGMAHGDAVWFMTPHRHDATLRVYFTSRGMAQVRVCFVDTYSAAGWRHGHPLQGRFD
jgi:hypothetical protein